MWMQSKRKAKEFSIVGFSVVEMMVVIVIIGLLGTLALSRYYAFIAKGRQAEAKMNLKTIGDLQETYKYEKEKYDLLDSANGVGAFGTSNTDAKCEDDGSVATNRGKEMLNELGFRPKDCENLRYGYHWTRSVATAESTKNSKKRVYPDCNETDKWEKTFSNGNLNNSEDIIKKCDD